MSESIKIERDDVKAEVVERYVGDFLRDGWKKVEVSDGEKVELNKHKNQGK